MTQIDRIYADGNGTWMAQMGNGTQMARMERISRIGRERG
jgi:hypothetical protein